MKKGQWLEAILIAVALLVLLMVLPAFKHLFETTAEARQCNWELLIGKLSKHITFGAGELPAECDTKKWRLDHKYLKEGGHLKKAGKAVKDYKKKYADKPNDVRYRKLAETFPTNYRGELAWAASKAIADDLKLCWDKAFKGGFEIAIGGWAEVWGITGPDTYACLLCSRIVTDPKIKAELGTDLLRELDTFMKYETVKVGNERMTYHDYIYEGMTSRELLEMKGPRGHLVPFSPTGYWTFNMNLPQGVLFEGLYRSDAAIGGANENQLYIWEYSQVAKSFDQAGPGCQLLIGS